LTPAAADSATVVKEDIQLKLKASKNAKLKPQLKAEA
jgi:hypothetical protein